MSGGGIKLSILIATTLDRAALFDRLYTEFIRQKTDDVEILFAQDNKEMSIGSKRQLLLTMAKGDYIVFFDSDDWPMPFYVGEILRALKTNPDCVGFLIHMTTNGKKPQVCCHSLRFKVWAEKKSGYDYVRSPGHFNPIKRDIALRVGFGDKRYGEDHDYSRRVTPLLKTEVFINKKLFHYRYSNKENFKKKYGFIK